MLTNLEAFQILFDSKQSRITSLNGSSDPKFVGQSIRDIYSGLMVVRVGDKLHFYIGNPHLLQRVASECGY